MKLKMIIVAVAIVGIAASLTVRHHAAANLREKAERVQQQSNQMAALAAEHQRLSNLLAQTNNSTPEVFIPELTKLRDEVEVLRKQTNDLRQQLAERPARPLPLVPTPNILRSDNSR